MLLIKSHPCLCLSIDMGFDLRPKQSLQFTAGLNSINVEWMIRLRSSAIDPHRLTSSRKSLLRSSASLISWASI